MYKYPLFKGYFNLSTKTVEKKLTNNTISNILLYIKLSLKFPLTPTLSLKGEGGRQCKLRSF